MKRGVVGQRWQRWWWRWRWRRRRRWRWRRQRLTHYPASPRTQVSCSLRPPLAQLVAATTSGSAAAYRTYTHIKDSKQITNTLLRNNVCKKKGDRFRMYPLLHPVRQQITSPNCEGPCSRLCYQVLKKTSCKRFEYCVTFDIIWQFVQSINQSEG